jgi:hypothetical protein
MVFIQYIVVALSLFMLFDQHWDSLAQASFLKLQYIPLFLLILSLAVINLMVETRIWKRLLGKSNETGEMEIFKAVIVSYTLKSVSTQYIGALLGKQHLFGLKKWKNNVFSQNHEMIQIYYCQYNDA